MSKKYFVELRSLKKFPHNELFTVSDEFFDDEKPDIEGGDLNVDVEVRRLGDGYSIDIRLDGTVRVVCDRCLGMLDMPVEAEMQLRAKDDDGLDYSRMTEFRPLALYLLRYRLLCQGESHSLKKMRFRNVILVPSIPFLPNKPLFFWKLSSFWFLPSCRSLCKSIHWWIHRKESSIFR